MATANFKSANTATRFRTARQGFIAFGPSWRKPRGLHRLNTAHRGRGSPSLFHLPDGRSHETLANLSRYHESSGPSRSSQRFRSVSFPIAITSPRNGGAALTGYCGRKTADPCDTSARETNTNTAAHFMFLACSRTSRTLASKF